MNRRGDSPHCAAESRPRASETNTPDLEAELTWAPDSRRLAYISGRDGTTHLFVYDFGTRTETKLTDGPAKGTGLEHADSLYRNWRAELAAQYARGRHFHMVLHPQGSGFGHRAELLNRFLTEACALPGLWNPTGTACAEWWANTYPAGTHLAGGSPHALETSVWRDYPGSLS